MRETYLFDYLVPNSGKLSGRKGAVPPANAHRETLTLAQLESTTSNCSDCRLRAGAGRVVFGSGHPHASLMFVGEGPGAEEDAQGLPFVGAAGQLLDKILAAAEIRREEVYIANVVKCRPPGNRQPQKDEIEACRKHLHNQIRVIRPAILVCLGSVAAQALLEPSARVSAVRGRWFEKDGMRLMATYHPAALLRDSSKKKPVWEDIQKIRDAYRSL